jgi:hypothetical protein
MMSRRHFGGLAAGAASTLALGACATREPIVLPALTFTHLEPIRFNAATAEVIDQYRPPLAPPYVEHTFPMSPAAAARAWARQRIQAAGAEGSVTVTIHDASVIAVPITTTAGVLGLLFDQQTIRFEASLEVTVEYRGPLTVESSARSHVSRSRSVPESITLNELDVVFHGLVEGLLQDLDGQLEVAIRQYLAPVIL